MNKGTNQHKSTTHPEEYFHVRLHDLRKPMTAETAAAYSHITLFFRSEAAVPLPGDTTQPWRSYPWYVSWATCLQSDQFCRRLGRTTARQHYFKRTRFLEYACFAADKRPTFVDAVKVVEVLPALPDSFATVGQAANRTWLALHATAIGRVEEQGQG